MRECTAGREGKEEGGGQGRHRSAEEATYFTVSSDCGKAETIENTMYGFF